MIPKVIHYCWFGRNPLPSLAEKCIESWKKYLPDYEIIEWNEDNFDVNMIPYTKEAYEAKKYAFVSDYARFWILYHYGGLYFDTDVEIIKPFDEIISKGPWMGCEFDITTHYVNGAINPGLGLGCVPQMKLLFDILNNYSRIHFYVDGIYNMKTIVAYTTEILLENGLNINNKIQECCGFTIYPKDYFNPLNSETKDIELSENTRSIHHYMASWSNKSSKFDVLKFFKNKVLMRFFPEMLIRMIVKYKKKKRENLIKKRFEIKL